MNTRWLALPLTLLAFAVLTAPSSAAARGEGGRGGGRPERAQRDGFSPGQAAETARRETGGRVLTVKPDKGGYRVKVLTPRGDVRYVPVPAPGR
jgi:hypothetical protein